MSNVSLLNAEFGTIGGEWVDWCLRLDFDPEDRFWSIQSWVDIALRMMAEEVVFSSEVIW